MAKRKRKQRARTHKPSSAEPAGVRKLSDIIIEMASSLLAAPQRAPSEPATKACLILAGAAWNRALGDRDASRQGLGLIEQIDWGEVLPWSEMRSDEPPELLDELVVYKRKHHPEDHRRVVTTVLEVGAALGMQPELLRLIGLMQDSRMGVYAREGLDGDRVVLRELVTDREIRAISTSGYAGDPGELWYVRILPPVAPGQAEHLVVTTPYVLIHPAEPDWQGYFHRTLPRAPEAERQAAHAQHMKFGPTRTYWLDFVFEAYVNHRPEAIYLKGLPDEPASRPHARLS